MNYLAKFLNTRKPVLEEIEYWGEQMETVIDMKDEVSLTTLPNTSQFNAIVRLYMSKIDYILTTKLYDYVQCLSDIELNDFGFDSDDGIEKIHNAFKIQYYRDGGSIYVDSTVHTSSIMCEYKTHMQMRHNKKLEHFFNGLISKES